MSEYISTLEEISEEDLDELQQQAKEQYERDCARLELTKDISDSRLRELAEAERDGNIPKLKLGDKVYWLPNILSFAFGDVAEATISMVSKGVKTLGWKYRAFTLPKSDHGGNRDKYQQDFSEYDIGKDYFMTRSEAERALAADAGKGENA